MKTRFILISTCIFLISAGFLIYFIINHAESKQVTVALEWGKNLKTKKDIPIISVSYRWGGVEEEPTWVMYPDKDEKWLVFDFGKIMRMYAKSISDDERSKAMKAPGTEFTYGWVEERKYEPRASIYELVMRTLGFDTHFRALLPKLGLNPLFFCERDAFFHCLKLARDFNEGRLQPNGGSEKQRRNIEIPERVPLNSPGNEGRRIFGGSNISALHG